MHVGRYQRDTQDRADMSNVDIFGIISLPTSQMGGRKSVSTNSSTIFDFFGSLRSDHFQSKDLVKIAVILQSNLYFRIERPMSVSIF
jgi:hypothetical protein